MVNSNRRLRRPLHMGILPSNTAAAERFRTRVAGYLGIRRTNAAAEASGIRYGIAAQIRRDQPPVVRQAVIRQVARGIRETVHHPRNINSLEVFEDPRDTFICVIHANQ